MLECGHQCMHLKNHQKVAKFYRNIDFHSKEACPLCNKNDIQERYFDVIMQGFSDDELYVHIPDCHHSLEVNGLDQHVKVILDDKEVKMLTCPKTEFLRNFRRKFSHGQVNANLFQLGSKFRLGLSKLL